MKKLFYLVVCLTSLFFYSCDPEHSEGDEPDPTFNQKLFLSELSDNILIPSFQDLDLKTQDLVLATDSFILDNSQAKLDRLQIRFKETYLAWQRVSFLEFGPSDLIGLRSNVNVFPADPQLIDQNSSVGNANLDALGNKTAKGFPAIDYLINAGTDSLILSRFTSNNRLDYLQKVVQDLSVKISQVNGEWSFYQNTFKNASGTDVGSSTGMLINALNQHYERFFRDGKIGIPLGVRSSGTARPQDSEAYYGGFSFELIKANYQAMKEVYLGNNSIGLDDYLLASNGADVDELIRLQMTIIESKLSQFNTTLPATIQNQNSEMLSTYQEIQKLIVYWKVDMPSRLGILITYNDNDGD